MQVIMFTLINNKIFRLRNTENICFLCHTKVLPLSFHTIYGHVSRFLYRTLDKHTAGKPDAGS